MTAWIGSDRKGYANFSQDSGVTWGGVVSFSDPNDSLGLIAITTLSNGEFAVAMSTSSAVRVRTTNTTGTAWSSFLSQGIAANTSYLDVTGISDGRVAVILTDDNAPNYEAIVAVTSASNASLGAFTQISPNSVTVYTPKLLYSGGVLSAVWQQGLGDLGYTSTSTASNYATWSSPGAVELDSTGGAVAMTYFACGTKAIVSAVSPALNGYLKTLNINADFSGTWSTIFRSTPGAVKSGDTVCTSNGQLLSLWLDANGVLNSVVSSPSSGSWTTTAPVTVPSSSVNESVALSPTPGGGAAAVTTQYVAPPNTTRGFSWSSSTGWSSEQSLFTSASSKTSVSPRGKPTSTGAVFAWREEILGGGASQPVTAISLFAPEPEPIPNPEPALAATGSGGSVEQQLAGMAAALGGFGATALATRLLLTRRRKR